MEKILQALSGGVGLFVAAFWGGLDGVLYVLITLIVLDYLSGCVIAIINKQLSSAVGFKGIAKKVAMLTLVGVAHILDAKILGGGDVLRSAVCFFYIANEGLSLLENTARLGIPIPKKLRDVLSQLNTDPKE